MTLSDPVAAVGLNKLKVTGVELESGGSTVAGPGIATNIPAEASVRIYKSAQERDLTATIHCRRGVGTLSLIGSTGGIESPPFDVRSTRSAHRDKVATVDVNCESDPGTFYDCLWRIDR